MKNKEHVNRLLGHLKGKITSLEYMLSRQEPVDNFRKVLGEMDTMIDNVEFEVNK